MCACYARASPFLRGRTDRRGSCVPIATADADTVPGNGAMESDSPHRVEIPVNFEDAPIDDLVQLIGSPGSLLNIQCAHKALQRTCLSV